ncbi:hypothetical protein Q4512_10390 [Oceanihabitans sp. 2_MG-2023]|uniref:hypothetical protein n=1 Tax=Oceanihabitans sp. 2_MG-2023 TaxID=3062661 RepID=UPI0026E28D7A|nr:hypothetical protein [Oceanihabitans sp. 2_MG-2023]MDO6597321.1 hypothetical protein [Oceanihabitans sp. 2_MG-2023]
MNTDELEQIFEELISVYQNLKAEVIVAELNKNTAIHKDDIIINNKSTFKRSHRRDILDVGTIDENNKLHLNLSRNGLYDHLPEGLFHTKDTSKGTLGYSELRKNYKQEESKARHFFSPLENEFFNQKLKIETKEQDLLNNFLNLDDEFLINFWKVDSSIPKKYLLKLLKLLPYSYKIAGDIKLTSLCLENIINKKVTIKKVFNPKEINNRKLNNTDNYLGTNFTLTNTYDSILQPVYQVEIGPILEDKIEDYLEKDGFSKFLNVFYDYFFPMEVEIKTSFKVNLKDGFLLSKEKEPIIGLTTLI